MRKKKKRKKKKENLGSEEIYLKEFTLVVLCGKCMEYMHSCQKLFFFILMHQIPFK